MPVRNNENGDVQVNFDNDRLGAVGKVKNKDEEERTVLVFIQILSTRLLDEEVSERVSDVDETCRGTEGRLGSVSRALRFGSVSYIGKLVLRSEPDHQSFAYGHVQYIFTLSQSICLDLLS